MRRSHALLFPILLLVSAGCDNTTAPETLSIAGTWQSAGFSDGQFSMTMVETARAVEGAGYRTSGGETAAFRVVGANTGRSASLLLDFDDRADINFQGDFSRSDDVVSLQGSLYGGGYAGETIVFQRQEE